MSTTNHGSPIPQSASEAPTHTDLMISPEAIAAESFNELASGAPAATHELKVWSMYADALESGVKTFEFRKDDRTPRFDVGDTLVLREWTPPYRAETEHEWSKQFGGDFTGREWLRRVTYIARGGVIPEGFCVMSVVAASGAPPSPEPQECKHHFFGIEMRCIHCGCDHPSWAAAPVASPLPSPTREYCYHTPSDSCDSDCANQELADERAESYFRSQAPVPPIALPSDDNKELRVRLDNLIASQSPVCTPGVEVAVREGIHGQFNDLRSRFSAAETRMTELRVLYEERVSRVVELEADLASLRSSLTEAEALLRRINLEDSNLDNWYDDIRPDVDNFLQPKP